MRLMKAQEVADILRTRKERVYELIRNGIIPSVRIGRQVRVDEETLRAWIADGGCGLTGQEKQRTT